MISKSLRKKLKNKCFKINIFETKVYLITNKDEFQEVYDDIKHDANTNDVHGLCLSTVENGKKDIFIGYFVDRDDVLVHECVHASLYILDNIEEMVHHNSELQPYLIQTLFRECKALANA